jgi:voltage-gated sodium channel
MPGLLKSIAESSRFQHFITAVILFAAVLVGAETYPAIVRDHGTLLHGLDRLVLGIFVLEILIKIGAEGKRPWRYFKDPWNVFDFAIVAAAFLPAAGQYVTVLRLARLLRVLRLVRAIPKLQLLVNALLKSIPSMGYVSMLLGLLFYVYAVAGVFLFGKNDPLQFGNLQVALITLFSTVTLEGWTDILYTQMYGCDVFGYSERPERCTAPSAQPALAVVYFISFVLVGTMVMLNLFIGVIMNGMSEAQAEEEARLESERRKSGNPPEDVHDELLRLSRQLAELQSSLDKVARHAEREHERQVLAANAVPAE